MRHLSSPPQILPPLTWVTMRQVLSLNAMVQSLQTTSPRSPISGLFASAAAMAPIGVYHGTIHVQLRHSTRFSARPSQYRRTLSILLQTRSARRPPSPHHYPQVALLSWCALLIQLKPELAEAFATHVLPCCCACLCNVLHKCHTRLQPHSEGRRVRLTRARPSHHRCVL